MFQRDKVWPLFLKPLFVERFTRPDIGARAAKVWKVRTPTFQSPKMLHHPPTAASTSRAAALQLKVNGRSGPWATAFHFRQKRREAKVRCVCKLNCITWRKRTLGAAAQFLRFADAA